MINGYQNPVIEVYSSVGAYIERIYLNLCDEDGLIEKPEFSIISRIRKNGELKTKSKGMRNRYLLSYNNFSDNANTQKIITIVNHVLNNCYFKIYPRRDVTTRWEYVKCTEKDLENIVLKLLNLGADSKGFEGISINFTAINKTNSIKLVETTNIRYIGYAITRNQGTYIMGD